MKIPKNEVTIWWESKGKCVPSSTKSNRKNPACLLEGVHGELILAPMTPDRQYVMPDRDNRLNIMNEEITNALRTTVFDFRRVVVVDRNVGSVIKKLAAINLPVTVFEFVPNIETRKVNWLDREPTRQKAMTPNFEHLFKRQKKKLANGFDGIILLGDRQDIEVGYKKAITALVATNEGSIVCLSGNRCVGKSTQVLKSVKLASGSPISQNRKFTGVRPRLRPVQVQRSL